MPNNETAGLEPGTDDRSVYKRPFASTKSLRTCAFGIVRWASTLPPGIAFLNPDEVLRNRGVRALRGQEILQCAVRHRGAVLCRELFAALRNRRSVMSRATMRWQATRLAVAGQQTRGILRPRYFGRNIEHRSRSVQFCLQSDTLRYKTAP